MDKKNTISEQLKEFFNTYDFNINTLSKYLQLPIEQIKNLSEGDIDFLPEEPTYRFNLFNKISFLYCSAIEDKDLKLCHYHFFEGL